MKAVILSPVNRTAALVVSKGVSYEPDCKITIKEYIGPPEIIPPHKHPNTPGFIDLTGRVKGRFKVLGLMAAGKGRWVVRCVCGTYSTRSAKSIKSTDHNPHAHLDACRECMHSAYRRREEQFRRTGKDIDLSEVW